ncbi:M16 family metallopeptidase [Erythrobacter litoralis]|uniref:Peptidase, M16 family protein n=1 Tax=Erythrobacter litoralis (strain HTCC2594) TaxID=314225 RepID=Q2NCK9_ERYLH|nr:M16 family metallopeptidase [Erythrobacter litoralis]ABC62582.1 peptidase, M16 family protein [Erythrobacter litoralis HTCC2594]
MKGPLFAAPMALVIAVPLAAQPTTEALVPAAAAQTADEAVWAYEESDLVPEQGYVFGVLDNGMRYVIRQNDTPEGTALVRMEVAAGRLDERDDERGLTHYIEHMAFNGSTNVPEGEMIKLLERLGLAFGADTNASNTFGYTNYRLDLPNNDPALLDTALFLMRETASELLFDEEAVERERGVILAEQRDRTNYAQLNALDQIEFLVPGSLLTKRFPGAGREDVDTADAATLRALWERVYVPGKTTLIVVGDFPVDVMREAIVKHFSSWQGPDGADQPDAGPVDPGRQGETDIYTDPALTEAITFARNAAWIDRPDTMADRRASILRALGYSILRRRLTKLARAEDPPFRSVGVGTSDIFEAGRQTTLTVAPIEGQRERGVMEAVTTFRQFVEFGVSAAEIAEQVANRRTGLENAVAGQATRSHGTFAGRATALVRNDRIPTSPEFDLALFEEVAATATPETVMAAIRADIVPLDNPLIRFQGPNAPEGGAEALRALWDAAVGAPVDAPQESAIAAWTYTDFGAPGEVVSDTVDERLDIRTITFDNGVRLNLKPTDLAEDRISLAVTIDGGNFIESREEPLKVDLTALFAAGGLGAYTQDELQTVLAGRSVGFSLGASTDSFRFSRTTTPRDLELQLQLIAAYLTDPGYRPEPIKRFRNGLGDFYARLTATPGAAYSSASGAILSDDDPRFSLPERGALEALTFDDLREAISDRLANGAMEVALVGDFDPGRAIDLVARTLGALPPREAAFRDYPDSRQRSFTATRERQTIYHDGEDNQASLRFVWPTRDYSDQQAFSELAMLRSVLTLKLTETLREDLGKAYSPSVGSSLSRYYPGYGTFQVVANIDVGEVEATRAAILETLNRLRNEPVDDDTLQRARQPILETIDNALKTNGSWMRYVRRAQSEPDRIDRFLASRGIYEAITAEQLQETAAQYLTEGGAVEFLVLPRPEDQADTAAQ